MTITEENNLRILIAEKGYLLKSKDDVYKEQYIDEFGNLMREHIPYYFEKAYVPESMTIEKVKEIYEEVKREEVEEWSN